MNRKTKVTSIVMSLILVAAIGAGIWFFSTREEPVQQVPSGTTMEYEGATFLIPEGWQADDLEERQLDEHLGVRIRKTGTKATFQANVNTEANESFDPETTKQSVISEFENSFKDFELIETAEVDVDGHPGIRIEYKFNRFEGEENKKLLHQEMVVTEVDGTVYYFSSNADIDEYESAREEFNDIFKSITLP